MDYDEGYDADKEKTAKSLSLTVPKGHGFTTLVSATADDLNS